MGACTHTAHARSGLRRLPLYTFTPMNEIAWIDALLRWLALPQQGLSTLFVLCTLSATLLPVGSEAAVLALLQLRPDWFWPAMFTATAGNTLGGAINWGLGRAAARAWQARTGSRASTVTTIKPPTSRQQRRARIWLRRWGARACLLSWLPVVGDPLCAAAGWLRLPFGACVFYMAVGKFLRYVLMTAALLWLWPA